MLDFFEVGKNGRMIGYRKYHVCSVIRSFVFLCRKVGSIKGIFCRYIIKRKTALCRLASLHVVILNLSTNSL